MAIKLKFSAAKRLLLVNEKILLDLDAEVAIVMLILALALHCATPELSFNVFLRFHQ